MAKVKEQIKTTGKIQLSDEEIANLSDAKFKRLWVGWESPFPTTTPQQSLHCRQYEEMIFKKEAQDSESIFFTSPLTA